MTLCEKQAWQSMGEAVKPHSIRINDSQADVTSRSRGASPIEVINGVGKRHLSR